MSKRTIINDIEKVKTSDFSKWIPLLCAGAAAGISILALKEIKNIKNEIITLKKDSKGSDNSELSKKMENMELQLKTITDYLKSKNTVRVSVPKEPVIIKQVVTEVPKVTIINEPEDEYEEVEVTDDEEN